MLFAEGPTACPFVALENDRDRRSDEPDHRHRCYAVPVPEPRAMAHQRAYCLTAQFTGCPIFQDWAVRAAARPVPLRPVPGPLSPEEQERIGAWATPPSWQKPAAEPSTPDEGEPLAAAAESPAATRQSEQAGPSGPTQLGAFDGRTSQPTTPESPIERLPSLPLDAPTPATDEEDEEDGGSGVAGTATATGSGAGLAAGTGATEPPLGDFTPPVERMQPPTYRPSPREEPAGRRSWDRREERAAEASTGHSQPARAAQSGRGGKPAGRDKSTLRREDVVPSWQRTRYEAYPSLGRRLDLGGGRGWLGRITTLFAVLAILGLAVALIMLAPGLLGLISPGSSPTAPIGAVSPTPSDGGASPSATVSASPTPQAGETWQVYVIASGDSICRIASLFGVSYAQLMGANPEITNPAFIRAGDQIDIPPDDFVPPSPAPDATPLGNPCG